MSALWFRTTDLARWGASNSGGDLSATQFDENTWWNYSNITALLARPIPSEIAYFVLVGDQLTVVMSDHTTRGPYTIPTSAFRFRGEWLASTTYLVNDVFTVNGSTYIVIFNHTSGLTFSAGANDGLGHNYYALMLANPGNSLPTGGAVGQMVIKTTTTDFAVSWGWPLPTGGTINQILMKNSSTNQDASWHTSPFVWAPPASPAGSGGQFLQTVDGTFVNTLWATPDFMPKPVDGSSGQILSTLDGTSANTTWIDPPSAGSSTYAALTDVAITSIQNGDNVYYDTGTGKWKNRQAQQIDYGTTSSSISLVPTICPLQTLTPTGNLSLVNGASPGTGPYPGKIGMITTVHILTSGTTSYNISFSNPSTDFPCNQGTLATGTVSGKQFTLTFMSGGDGKLYEIARQGPF